MRNCFCLNTLTNDASEAILKCPAFRELAPEGRRSVHPQKTHLRNP